MEPKHLGKNKKAGNPYETREARLDCKPRYCSQVVEVSQLILLRKSAPASRAGRLFSSAGLIHAARLWDRYAP